MRRVASVRWAAILAAGLGMIRAWGADGPPPAWPVGELRVHTDQVTDETIRLVGRLGSPDFATREKASKELAEKGLENFPGLKEVVDGTPDEEVRARTAWALLTGQLRFPRNVPADVNAGLRSYALRRLDLITHPPATVSTRDEMIRTVLLRQANGSPEEGEVFYRVALEGETDARIREFLGWAAAQHGGMRARLALAEGNVQKAQDILREDAVMVPEARADYAALMGMLLGEALDPRTELQKPGIDAQTLRPEMGLVLQRAKRDTERAVPLAVQSGDRAWLPVRAELLMARKYDELGWLGQRRQSITHDALEGALAYSMGEKQAEGRLLLQGAIDEAKRNGVDEPFVHDLLRNGRADVVIAARRKPDTRDVAFDLLGAQLQIRAAIAVMGDPRYAPIRAVKQLREMGLTASARKVLFALRPDEAKLGDDAAEFEFDYAAELEWAGSDKAKGWRDRAMRLADEYDRPLYALDVRWAQLDKEAVEVAKKAWEQAGTQLAQGPAADNVGAVIGVNGQMEIRININGEIRINGPNLPAAAAADPAVQAAIRAQEVAQLRALVQLAQQRNIQLQGVQAKAAPSDPGARAVEARKTALRSERWNLQSAHYSRIAIGHDAAFTTDAERQEADFWFNDILRKKPAAERYALTKRILQGQITDEEASELVDLVVGRVPISEEMETPLPRTITPMEAVRKAAGRLHQMHRDEWMARLILRWYAQENDPTCLAVLGDVALEKGDGLIAVGFYQQAAVVNVTDASLMWRLGAAFSRAAEKGANAGMRETGEQLKKYAPLLVLGNVGEARRLGEVMDRFGGKGPGEQWIEDYLTRFGRVMPADLAEHFRRTRERAEARGDFAEALEAQKGVLISATKGGYDESLKTMAMAADYQRLRALVAFERNDWATVAEALESELNNGPPDVALMEKVMPGLQRANGAAAAKVLEIAAGRLREVVADDPEAERYRRELERVERLQK